MSDLNINVEKNVAEEEVAYPYMVAVKFHNSSRPYSFGTEMVDLAQGDMVVVETSQGVEMGEVQASPLNTEKFPPKLPLKPVLRKANEQDLKDYEDNFSYAENAFQVCQEEIKDLELEMNLLSADYMLDRSKVLFIYVADQRVDFRELLKRLNSRLHCKIELRQIGERDKAKMVGGIGMCGRECCCSKFKNHFDIISINMAKNQLLALNIDKLSGMCGKLMCCLKYEDDNYKELTEGLPKMGAHIEFEGDMYKVTSMNVMTNEARIENADTFQLITIDQLKQAEVKKGVSIGKRTLKGPKTLAKPIGTTVKPSERATKPEELSFEEFHIPSIEEKKPEVVEKPKPQNNNRNRDRRNNNNNNRRASNNNRPQQRRQEPTNNTNVTTRSFKSSKTIAKEKGE